MLFCRLFVLLLSVLVTQLNQLQAQNLSILIPTITLDPASGQFHLVDYQLFCEATGDPTPVYSWLRNGTVITSNQTSGTYTLPTNTFAENGYYVCHATNKWGTAVSRTALVQQAFLNQFASTDILRDQRKVGEYLSLVCRQRPDSVPGKTFRWETNTYYSTPVQIKNIESSNRIQIDQNTGNLYFANLMPGDFNTSTHYICLADTSLAITKGSRVNLTMDTPASTATFINPGFYSPTYTATPDTVTVVEGEQLSLRCFFYGLSTPVISWYRDGQLLSLDSISNFNTTYSIASVTMSDDGVQFKCEGNNEAGRSQQTFTLNVESKPNFNDNSSIVPVDLNGTIGYSASFSCEPFANPEATVTWFTNGQLVDRVKPPARYSVSADTYTLTISDLCLQCPNGTTDQMVVTCNASNVHGYELKPVYLNILQPTTVTGRPSNQDVPAGQTARFLCSANSDPTTPEISFIWLFNNTIIKYQQNKIYATCTDISCELTVEKVGPSDGGIYTCRATNGYSDNDSSAILLVLPAAFTAATIWYVWLIIAVLVVLLLLLLLCCWYCKDNDGDEYPVDEVEHKMGNDPEGEIRDSRLLEFQLPPGTVINNNNYQLWTVAGSRTVSKYGDGASTNAAPQMTIPPPPPVYTTSHPQLYPVAVYRDQVDAESYSTEADTRPAVIANYPAATGSRPLTPRSPTGYAYPAHGPAVMVPVHQNWPDEVPERDVVPVQMGPGHNFQPAVNPRPGYAVVDPRDIDDVTPVPGGYVQLGANYQAPHYYNEQVGGPRVVAYQQPQHDWLQGPAGYEAYPDPGFNDQRYPQYNQRRAPSESSV